MTKKITSPKSVQELAARVAKLRGELGELPFNAAAGKIKNVHQPRQIRKDIARALTTIHEVSYGKNT